jgi:hypothetical protein
MHGRDRSELTLVSRAERRERPGLIIRGLESMAGT